MRERGQERYPPQGLVMLQCPSSSPPVCWDPGHEEKCLMCFRPTGPETWTMVGMWLLTPQFWYATSCAIEARSDILITIHCETEFTTAFTLKSGYSPVIEWSSKSVTLISWMKIIRSLLELTMTIFLFTTSGNGIVKTGIIWQFARLWCC